MWSLRAFASFMRDVVDIAGCTVLRRRWSLVVSHLAIANASSLGGWNSGFALGGLVEHFRGVLKFMTQMGVADLLLCSIALFFRFSARIRNVCLPPFS